METISGALKVYRSIVGESLKAAIGEGVAVAAERRGIFSWAVIIWLMIFQRLNSDHSLSEALEQLRGGRLDDLLKKGSLPAQVRRISGCTGGFARARERISISLVESTADRINEALNQSHKKVGHCGRQVYVVDGSTIRVAHTAKNIRAYPQYHNQHGKAHFPLIQVSVATNAVTGVVLRPAYGPYNGKKATNELSLAEELFGRIPAGSVVIGDRFYGCCRFADMAKRAGHDVIARVKECNAKKFIGIPTNRSGESAVEWRSNRSRDGSGYCVSGRFVWHTFRRRGYRPTKLVLFTTADLPWQQVVELYALRWNVELDLRDIKSTLDMDMLYSKTPTMSEKELILGITAYNLVRHIMVASAKSLKLAPRDLSFSRVLKRVHAVATAPDDTEERRSLVALLFSLNSLKLPRRKKKRLLEPRKVWQKGHCSFMTHSRNDERKALRKFNVLPEK